MAVHSDEESSSIGRYIGVALARARREHLRQEIGLNLLIGIAISIGLLILSDSPWLRDLDDDAFDWMVQIVQRTPVALDQSAFSVVDIDDRTYLDWGRPLLTNRMRLTELMGRVLDAEARLLIVDIDLSRPAPNADHDAMLVDFLRQYDGGTPVVFVANIESYGRLGSLPRYFSPITADVIAARSNYHEAAALVEIGDDGVARRIGFYEMVCTPQNQPQVFLSLPLLVYALLNGESTPQRATQTILPAHPGCGFEEHNAESQSGSWSLANQVMPLYPNRIERRILFNFPWSEPGTTPVPVGMADGSAPAVVVRSAQDVLRGTRDETLAWAAGRVVIIGGSHSFGRDLHMTPIGEMSGSMILINAIYTVERLLHVRELPFILVLLSQSLVIFVLSYCFTRFNSSVGMLVSGAIVLMSVVPLNVLAFQFGYWANFLLPLLAVWFQRLVRRFSEERRGAFN